MTDRVVRAAGVVLTAVTTAVTLLAPGGSVAAQAAATSEEAPSSEEAPRLQGVLDGIVDAPLLDQLHWGVLAVDAATGEVLVSRSAHRKFIPASNMKIPVGVAALARLGPEHRFTTEVRLDGVLDPVTGRLDGDLVVLASGDPSLSARYWSDDRAPLDALADSVRAAGVTAVSGVLVVDATRWDSTTVVGSWMWDNLPWYYSAPGGAFAVAEGEIEVVVRGAERPGEPARVTASPLFPATADHLDLRVRTVERAPDDGDGLDLTVTWLPESRVLRLEGTVAVGVVDTLRLADRDPVRHAAAALLAALERRGVRVDGGWQVAWPGDDDAVPDEATPPDGLPADAVPVASLASPPLIDLVEGMLEPSQNWMAEQLVRALGRSDSTRAGWTTGLDAMERTLVDEVGVDSLDLALRDGSGMSAYNLVTPRALVRMLAWAAERPWGDAFREALAEPGEEDSTLERRLTGLEGRVWAKTGTISNVNALSGYLVTDGGRTVIFSILTNGSGIPAAPVREGMDALVRALAAGG